MPKSSPPLLRPEEVRERLGGISERTLRNYVYRGDIAVVKVGRLLRFTEQAVAEYIERQTVEAAS